MSRGQRGAFPNKNYTYPLKDMLYRHVAIGVLVAAVWGFNFTAAHVALVHIAPLLLVALRFSLAALPALFLPRPTVSWPRMAALASTFIRRAVQFPVLGYACRNARRIGVASDAIASAAYCTIRLDFSWGALKCADDRWLGNFNVGAAVDRNYSWNE